MFKEKHLKNKRLFYNKSISCELSEFIRKRISQNWGVGRIFNHIRKMKRYEHISSLGTLRIVLVEFKKLGKLPSREKINYHFRTKVFKEDWEGVFKSEILSDLHNPTP